VLSLISCGSPPEFALEAEPPPAVSREKPRSFSIGSLATPPPGEYRFVKIRSNGQAELRELHTVNGPGPWLTYIGRVLLPSPLVRKALATIDATAPASAPGDDRAPCVLAFDTAASDAWQGCAYPQLAQQVLSEVPRLTAPDVEVGCRRRVCQVRLLREEPTARHGTAIVLQDAVLDENGSFWCASVDAERSGESNTLHVERGRIVQRDAQRVFEWLTKNAAPAAAGQPAPSAGAVMLRGPNSDWIRSGPEADAIRRRWQQLANRLPAACQSQ
jgi:hypothetical protein